VERSTRLDCLAAGGVAGVAAVVGGDEASASRLDVGDRETVIGSAAERLGELGDNLGQIGGMVCGGGLVHTVSAEDTTEGEGQTWELADHERV
jgi:hypothetical protein